MTGTENEGDASIAISVPVAIAVGLFSSFIQSLGLTIQRKSHIQNSQLPFSQQRSEWRRKTWIFGFITFLIANIGGSIFQIGALPIVMLAPLGAVSLLYNALLARFLLDDFFSKYMILGTTLIGLGAILIGYFGVVHEAPHSLDDLLALFSRPAFVAFSSILMLCIVGVLVISHLAEWQLYVRLSRPKDSQHPRKKVSIRKKPLHRRWSAPSLAPVAEVSESSSGIATPVLEIADEATRRGIPVERVLVQRGGPSSTVPKPGTQNGKGYGSLNTRRVSFSLSPTLPPSPVEVAEQASVSSPFANSKDPAVRRMSLWLAAAYSSASGTLSGACLLLAKSGVDLLVLTLNGHNQFDRWESYSLVIIMLIAALLQLWYLNKSLKLASPPLVCPLAFCFYNTSSIALGLVYFNELDSLSFLSLTAVIVGTVVLLTGVWIVSLHGTADSESDTEECQATLGGAILASPRASVESSSPSREPTELDALLPTPSNDYNQPQPQSSSGVFQPSDPFSPADACTLSPRRRKSRSRSGSASHVGGLGLHMPGLPSHPVDFDPTQESVDPHVGVCSDMEEGRLTSPRKQQASPLTSPTSNLSPTSRQKSLYGSLFERGLSIGFSPSSPGFHLGSTFEYDPDLHWETQGVQRLSQRRFHARRTFSETDAATTSTRNANPLQPPLQNVEEGQNQDTIEQESDDGHSSVSLANSTWARVIPALDIQTLSDKLARIKLETRSWFGSRQADV